MPDDPVDNMIEQWRRQRPDLDAEQLGSSAIVSRIGRLPLYGVPLLEAALARHNLKLGEFDVLSALRRQGPPYELTPGDMMRHLVLSSAGVTHRINRLEHAGFVERRQHPDDRRVVIVKLTRVGKKVIDRAIETHLAAEHELLDALSDNERHQLDRIARKLLASLQRRRQPLGE